MARSRMEGITENSRSMSSSRRKDSFFRLRLSGSGGSLGRTKGLGASRGRSGGITNKFSNISHIHRSLLRKFVPKLFLWNLWSGARLYVGFPSVMSTQTTIACVPVATPVVCQVSENSNEALHLRAGARMTNSQVLVIDSAEKPSEN